MLFIYHNEGQVRNGREYGRPSSYHNVRLTIANPLPLLGPLVVAQGGMQNGNFVAEDLMQIGCHRRGETDLRYQQDCRAAFRQ